MWILVFNYYRGNIAYLWVLASPDLIIGCARLCHWRLADTPPHAPVHGDQCNTVWCTMWHSALCWRILHCTLSTYCTALGCIEEAYSSGDMIVSPRKLIATSVIPKQQFGVFEERLLLIMLSITLLLLLLATTTHVNHVTNILVIVIPWIKQPVFCRYQIRSMDGDDDDDDDIVELLHPPHPAPRWLHLKVFGVPFVSCQPNQPADITNLCTLSVAGTSLHNVKLNPNCPLPCSTASIYGIWVWYTQAVQRSFFFKT